MSDKNIIKAKLLPDGTVVQMMPDGSARVLQDETDWERLKNMSEDEIEEGAASDPDNPPIGEEEFRNYRGSELPQYIRRRMKMTQEQFAQAFHIPIGTLRDWEQGARQPDSAARTLLKVIAHDPDVVLRALE